MSSNPYELPGFSEGLTSGWEMVQQARRQTLDEQIAAHKAALEDAQDDRERQQLQSNLQSAELTRQSTQQTINQQTWENSGPVREAKLQLQAAQTKASNASSDRDRAIAQAEAVDARSKLQEMGIEANNHNALVNATKYQGMSDSIDLVDPLLKDPANMSNLQKVAMWTHDGNAANLPSPQSIAGMAPYVIPNELKQIDLRYTGSDPTKNPGGGVYLGTQVSQVVMPTKGDPDHMVFLPVAMFKKPDGTVATAPQPAIVQDTKTLGQRVNALASAGASAEQWATANNQPVANFAPFMRQQVAQARLTSPKNIIPLYSGDALDQFTGQIVGTQRGAAASANSGAAKVLTSPYAPAPYKAAAAHVLGLDNSDPNTNLGLAPMSSTQSPSAATLPTPPIDFSHLWNQSPSAPQVPQAGQ